MLKSLLERMMMQEPTMIVHDSFEWVNAAIGGVALLLTVGAVVQATGAKKAAWEARQAIYRRNAAEDMAGLSRLASGLLTYLETEQYEMALYIAREFISACPKVREHHRGVFGVNGGKLEVAVDLVGRVSQRIQTGARQALIPDAQRVVGDLSALAGMLNRKIDEEGQ